MALFTESHYDQETQGEVRERERKKKRKEGKNCCGEERMARHTIFVHIERVREKERDRESEWIERRKSYSW